MQVVQQLARPHVVESLLWMDGWMDGWMRCGRRWMDGVWERMDGWSVGKDGWEWMGGEREGNRYKIGVMMKNVKKKMEEKWKKNY